MKIPEKHEFLKNKRHSRKRKIQATDVYKVLNTLIGEWFWWKMQSKRVRPKWNDDNNWMTLLWLPTVDIHTNTEQGNNSVDADNHHLQELSF